jgi:hypothetical protein
MMDTAPIPALAERIEMILTNIAKEIRPCKECGAQLAFVLHKTGKLAPYVLSGPNAGLNHFIDCPSASRFRRKNGSGK